jgi:hypothetical protein
VPFHNTVHCVVCLFSFCSPLQVRVNVRIGCHVCRTPETGQIVGVRVRRVPVG